MNEEIEIRSNISEYENRLVEVADAYDRLQSFFDEKGKLISDILDKSENYLTDYIKKLRIPESNRIALHAIKAPFNEKSYDDNVVSSIYRLMVYGSFVKEGKALDNNSKGLESALFDAEHVLRNNLVWTFTGKSKKDRSVRAMMDVSRLYDLGYIERVDDIINRFRNFDFGGARAEFLKHTKEFVDFANKSAGTHFYIDDDPIKPDFRKLNESRKEFVLLLGTLENVEEKISNQGDKVKFYAGRMADIEAIKILKDVSIDEVNRDKRGIRTSALKNAGINSIADALIKSEYAIASIYGISELNAHVIKRIAQERFIDTKGSVKLKLNADDKNVDSTSLINELYKYIKLKEQFNELDQIYTEYGRPIKTAVTSISNTDGDSSWLYADIEKKSFYNNVNLLYNALDEQNIIGKFNEIRQIDRQIYSKELSDSELWKYYEDNSARCISVLDELLPGYFGNSDTFYGLPEELAEQIQEECIFPDGLLVTLRRYQEWGVKYILHQKKVLLGDEMGLGKTIQAIATMVSLRNVGDSHFLVVCPASVLVNWCREIEQHSKLKAIKMHGSGRKYAFERWIKEGGVGVTTYETVGNFELPDGFNYSMLVVDEAHYVKNSKALRTANVIKLGYRTGRILYMTGTPLENNVEEMIELISQLQPKVAEEIKSIAFLYSSARIFRQKVAPVYYRRKREDVLTELPELIESKEWCTLVGEEKRIYEDSVLNGSRHDVRKVSWNIDDLSKSSKAKRLEEIVEQVKDDGRKLIVFSFYLDTIDKLYEHFHEICLFPIKGGVNVNKRQEIIDEFEKAPAGTMLVAQITAGGTGLNIQAASVVVIAEPQVKPSIENQAISRAYRMGQTRNVLVYRLLCENTIDERMINSLEAKQQIFEEFADQSVAAQANLELDNKTMDNLIEEEIERIQRERAEKGGEELPDNTDMPSPNRRNMDKTSVTGRISVVSQPYGGYLNASYMKVISINDGLRLNPQENKTPSNIGLVVDYLSRFMMSNDATHAFSVSASGAIKKDLFTHGDGKEITRFNRLLSEIKGIDDKSIINACLIIEYDVWERNVFAALEMQEKDPVIPDQNTIENIRIMVQRSISFFKQYGPVIKEGFTFEPNGYSNVVINGDGDFMTKDTVWDFKVSKNEPTKDHTLQLLMYYIMGKHSGNPIYSDVNKIGIFNPRLNKVYLYNMNEYPEKLYKEIERDIICYE